jgi:hypothetical protein
MLPAFTTSDLAHRCSANPQLVSYSLVSDTCLLPDPRHLIVGQLCHGLLFASQSARSLVPLPHVEVVIAQVQMERLATDRPVALV